MGKIKETVAVIWVRGGGNLDLSGSCREKSESRYMLVIKLDRIW